MEQKRRRSKRDKEQELARQRALVILQVRNGALTAKQGAARLGVSRKTYYEWEDKSLRAMALEWLANICSHIPNRGEQMVRYYGHYSNVSRGKRQMEGNDDAVPSIIESQGDEKTFRRNWARLIQKIYEVDPLVCPKCKGAMRIVSSIEDASVIRAILDHLGIWLVRSRPPPKIHDPPIREYGADFYSDPVYSWDQYIQS
jgi:hypothetical protein